LPCVGCANAPSPIELFAFTRIFALFDISLKSIAADSSRLACKLLEAVGGRSPQKAAQRAALVICRPTAVDFFPRSRRSCPKAACLHPSLSREIAIYAID
jgi:hypothetical protein